MKSQHYMCVYCEKCRSHSNGNAFCNVCSKVMEPIEGHPYRVYHYNDPDSNTPHSVTTYVWDGKWSTDHDSLEKEECER